MKRGWALRWRARTLSARLTLLNVDLSTGEAARYELDTDLVTRDVTFPRPLGGDRAAAKVDLDFETGLAAVLLGHPGLVFKAGAIRKNLHWRRALPRVLRTQGQVHGRTERTCGVPEVGRAGDKKLISSWSTLLPVGIEIPRQIVFYCEWIKRLDVGVESEEVVFWPGLADNRAGLVEGRGEAPAVVIAVTPDQSGARGLRRAVITISPGLVKFLALGKHFSEWILANNRLPVDGVHHCFTPG